jgi:nucleoside-diphosphate-sugar epimerase
VTLVSISGGAGFLGLHLARWVLADGGTVRTLDVAPLEDRELERAVDGRRVEEVRGDIRSERDVRTLVEGADVLVHAAAALPIQSSRAAIRSVNVEGTANVLACALTAGVRRVVLISSTAVYGVPERHPIVEDDPLVGVGWYGESKIEAEHLAGEFGRRGLDVVIIRPKTFIGPERGMAVNVGAGAFGTVRDDLTALIDHAGSGSRLFPVPVMPAELSLRALELARLSPLAEWHYKTAHKDSFVSIERARELLGWEPRLSNADTLCATYDWYLEHLADMRGAGTTHRVPWNQQALGVLKKIA